MNANAIVAPASVSISLLVNYGRERRQADEHAVYATDPSDKRLYVQQAQRLTEAMNHTAIRALRAGLDIDMLAWVVQSATDHQLETLACEEINTNDHMTKLVEAMRAPAKPKAPAKARKAPALKRSDAYYVQVAKALANATSRELAAELLDDGLTVNDLNHIWTLAGRTDRIPTKLRKAERLEHMIENLVGYRLDSEAIRTGAMS